MSPHRQSLPVVGPVFCINCDHNRPVRTVMSMNEYYCKLEDQHAYDPVTGQKIITYSVLCKSKNSDLHCKDYEPIPIDDIHLTEWKRWTWWDSFKYWMTDWKDFWNWRNRESGKRKV